jgi:cytochrome c-type biogenesis protein CcmH/NrfF
VLWLGPAAMLLIGGCAVLVLVRRYRTNSAAAADGQQGLTAAEAARLSDILRDGER